MAYRVLITDDSPAMRSFVRRVIELSGFELSHCFEAGDGDAVFVPLVGRRSNESSERHRVPDKVFSQPPNNSVVPTLKMFVCLLETRPHSSLGQGRSPIPSCCNWSPIAELYDW